MTDTIARYKQGKLTFETMVDLESAMKFKREEKVDINNVIRDRAIYLDQKKGMRAGTAELENVFGTTDFFSIVGQIVKKGQIEVTKEFRDEALESKKKQVVDFLVRNAVDVSTGRPFTPDMLINALREAGTRIENKPVDVQITGIIESLKRIIPIKIETKKIRVTIPAIHTGKIYGTLQEYKEKEDWLSNGDLQIVLNIPVGIQMEFYDKLNSVTHGSAMSEEMKQ